MESNEQNKPTNRDRGIDTWNRLTTVRGEGEGVLDERRGRDQPKNIYT